MNQKHTLIVTIMMFVTFLAGCNTSPIQNQTVSVVEGSQKMTAVNASSQNPTMVSPNCAQPTPELAADCTAMEQAILATTVRLEFYRWRDGSDNQLREHIDSGISHATVKDGRYLLTHNHFYIDLQESKSGETVRFSIYRANGELLVMDMPITAFSVVAADSQTLLLDFQEYAGVGFFDVIDMPSATFAVGESLNLQPGMEVAQVDWDGATTHVDWVQVGRVLNNHDTPQVELANVVMPGASGGGIFWNGYHIGNNWKVATAFHQGSNQIDRQYSIAALDSWPALTFVAPGVAVPNLH